MIHLKPTIDFGQLEKESIKNKKYQKNIARFKILSVDHTNQPKVDFNETGKFSNYSLASGYSPAIGTNEFKTNITLKMKNKELLKKYGKIDFKSLNR